MCGIRISILSEMALLSKVVTLPKGEAVTTRMEMKGTKAAEKRITG